MHSPLGKPLLGKPLTLCLCSLLCFIDLTQAQTATNKAQTAPLEQSADLTSLSPENLDNSQSPDQATAQQASNDRISKSQENSLKLTKLAQILRNPWVGLSLGLLLMLILRYIYNYGRK